MCENELRRFKPTTDDPKKLKHISELIEKIGKEDVVFLLQNLKLNLDAFQSRRVSP